jgi:hypothetical protein
VAKGSRRDRGIKRAPFVVLIGAQMPAILTEIGFVTNSKEEAMLKKPEYRQKIAESILKGLQGYAETLGQMEVAQTGRRDGSVSKRLGETRIPDSLAPQRHAPAELP